MIVIVPDLPPHVNGLGDYAFLMAKTLRDRAHIQTTFIVTQPGYTATHLDGFSVKILAQSNRQLLVQLLLELMEKDRLLHLHYVGYGYHKRGIPAYLAEAIAEVKQTVPAAKLITTFHELFAQSRKPWTSSFWLENFQKKICQHLLTISDLVITSRSRFADQLQRWRHKEVTVFPVYSNVGELDQPLVNDQRKPRLIIFGSKANRKRSYEMIHEIQYTIQQLGIQEIIDIGEPITLPDALDIPIIQKGAIEPKQISAELQVAKAAFIGFPSAEWLAKSGVFASMAAHAVIPVCTGDAGGNDGLNNGINYINVHQWTATDPNQVGLGAFEWYRHHSLLVQADAFTHLIKTIST